ncbi:MAG: ribose 5-phosphate isomerase B [Proteobacteria bacterium]|jgi:ribose 5-phosphate isomerase B|nr:ribose 5-phosphate isomerase B [Pelagibacterales bacterium]MDA0763833.1 ribose 5-phosphate isomerase B [Pseudomonadota bacterium]MDA1136310.1 ribose 5-phosphate isomerase B [Pseudomonadota bacterium]|tara:strand:+ start:1205 stop:1633 length:429 start_codon:yes stop_codon:yes gene_type:complete
MNKKIFLSSDHGGFELKTSVMNFLKEDNYDVEDLGCFSLESVDYPDYANLMAKSIKNNINSYGILFCGTGIGVSIAANRHSHIRAALCTSVEMASKSRKHNDANVLALGGRILNNLIIKDIVFQFLNTDFEEGRHRLRVNKL